MKITLLTGKTFDLETAFDFPLAVVSSWRSRRLTLRIDSKKRKAVLTMPRFCSKKKAFEFIDSHRDWIEQHLAQLPTIKEFTDGDEILLFGNKVEIRHNSQSLQAPKLTDGVLEVGGEKEFLHRRVKDYIKKEAKKEFLRRSRFYAKKIDCTVESVSVKDTKSRWGSCSSLNNINYSWRIALAPKCTIEYLIAHEVAHLKHRDHSQAFWQCVNDLYADAQIGRDWLKSHGNDLYLYQ